MLPAPLPDRAWKCLNCGYRFGTCTQGLPSSLPTHPRSCPICQNEKIMEELTATKTSLPLITNQYYRN